MIVNSSLTAQIGKKADHDTKSADKADKEYSKAVEHLKAVQERVYVQELPQMLQEMQVMEEDRLSRIKSWLGKVGAVHTERLPQLPSVTVNLERSVAAMDVQEDLQKFIERNRSPQSGPQFAVYEPFDAARPYLTDVADPTPDYHRSVTISKPRVRAIYDYVATDQNELNFRVNDWITVLQKPDDGEGWWQGELNGKVGMFPSNFVESAENSPDPSPRASIQEARPTVVAKKSVAPPPAKKPNQCKARFDYAAQDEGELSMTAGDVFLIETEDSGWFFVYNQKGEYGRIPSNYTSPV